MTAHQIQRVLLRHRYRRNFCLPNYTPAGWFEADVWEVMKDSGLAVEYEVKVSRSDFLADREKVLGGRAGACRKHEMLAAGHPAGPSRFYFVTPPGLLAVADLPSWAGLIEVAGTSERKVRPAPRLHREGVPAKTREHARGVCYWRFYSLLLKGGHG